MMIKFILEILLLSLQMEVDEVEEDAPAADRGRNHAGQGMLFGKLLLMIILHKR